VLGSGLLSAFFVNDTVCLVFTPVLLAALGPLGIRPTPYLIGLALGSNVGSALTVVGNPQNMLIGLWSGIGFAGFALHMLPVVAGGLALTCIILLRLFRKQLGPAFPARASIPIPVHLDRRLVIAALGIFGVAFAAWLAGASLPKVAIAGGALMLAVARRDPRPALEKVEWELLQRPGGPAVAEPRADVAQSCSRLAGDGDERDLCRKSAPDRVDGEPHRSRKGGGSRGEAGLLGVRQGGDSGHVGDLGVGRRGVGANCVSR
jgi:hypothetical protein